jgi:acyl dehydratase
LVLSRRRSRYTRLDLEPLSFDDLPLGGEWTTRRRTISESEIALFSGVAGDFSPLTIEAVPGQPRLAPPALLVAIALGLGSIDMPVPSVAEWEWLNWRFPRPVHAGDTVYARWTLTQKRPPVGGSATSIVVWRVDVHTADGAMCAEGEVGAKIRRRAGVGDRHRSTEPAEPAATAPATVSRRRRRRRPTSGNGAVADAPAVAAPTVPAPTVPAVKPEKQAVTPAGRSPGTPAARRRRRRRPAGTSGGPRDGGEPAPGTSPASASEPAPPAPLPASAAADHGTLSRVIRRLRRT